MKYNEIKNDNDYQRALKRLEKIFDSPVNSTEGDEAKQLTILIDNYENAHHPIDAPNPADAIKFRKEQKNGQKLI